jgi:hypothetical protein
MRFWFSIPFLGRTRIGFSVSDRELRRHFPRRPLRLRATPEEQAEIDRKAQAFAKRWAPFVAAVIKIILISIAVFALWRLVLAVAAHAGQ